MLKQVINMARIQEITRKKYDSAFFVVIPKNFMTGFGWGKGTDLEFTILGKDKLKLEHKKPSPANPGGDL